MILDAIENAGRYHALCPGMKEALAYLPSPDLRRLAAGRHDLQGDRLYASVATTPSRPRSECRLEVHRRYIDIQMCVSGTDDIGWRPLAACRRPVDAFDVAKDFGLFADEPWTWVRLPPGAFMIFFPEDAHAPLAGDGPLSKVVLKLAVDGGAAAR